MVVDILRLMLPVFFGWMFAQVPKFLFSLIRKKPEHIFASGGMPSTHTSSVIAMVTHIAFMEHFTGTTFAIAAVFGIVTAFDACNVRYQCGKVTEQVNTLIDKVYENDAENKPEKMKVIKGHTLLEVIVGAIIGIAVGCVYTFVEYKIFG